MTEHKQMTMLKSAKHSAKFVAKIIRKYQRMLGERYSSESIPSPLLLRSCVGSVPLAASPAAEAIGGSICDRFAVCSELRLRGA